MIRFLQSGNKSAKYLLGGMLLILCLSMCAYLIPGFLSGTTLNQAGVVASVGGQEITSQAVQTEVQKLISRFGRQQQYPESMMPFLRQQAAQQLVQEAELRYEAERMDLKVSDQEVRDELRANPEIAPFLFPQGNWIGQQKYEELLRQGGRSVEDFEGDVRFELIKRKVVTAVTAGATVSPAEIEKAYKEQNTKVKFDYAILKSEDVEKSIKPTDGELKAYYDANQARYKNSIPEKRQVRYFLISDKLAESKISITPADIEQNYRIHQDQYRLPDRVRVRHILIATPKAGADGKVDQKGVDAARAKAEDILKQVNAGSDFAELAKKNSDDPGSKEQGGELGWVVKGQTVPEFEKAAFSQSKGQTSNLVQTNYGFHIIQTEDKEVAHVKSLSEVKDSIEQTVKQQKIGSVLDQMANAASTEARASDLDKAASKFDTKVLETNPVSRTDSLPGVGSSQELMNTIFTVDQKSGVQFLRIPQGVVVFQVEKIVPPRNPGFEEVKDRVTTDFKSERSSTLLSQKTTELSDRAHSQHDLAKVAKELGATFKSSDLVTHTSQVPDVGSMSGSANVAFSLKQGEISGPLNTGRNGLVLQVTERQEPPLTGDEFTKAQDTLRDQLLGQKRQEAMQLFMYNLDERLRKEGKVKENQSEQNNLGRRRRS